MKEVEVKNKEITLQFGSVCEPAPNNGHMAGTKRHIVLGLTNDKYVAAHPIEELENGEASITVFGGSVAAGDLGEIIEVWEYENVLKAYKKGWEQFIGQLNSDLESSTTDSYSVELPADMEELLFTNSNEEPRTYILT